MLVGLLKILKKKQQKKTKKKKKTITKHEFFGNIRKFDISYFKERLRIAGTIYRSSHFTRIVVLIVFKQSKW